MTRSSTPFLLLMIFSFLPSGASLASNGSQHGAISIEVYDAPVEDVMKTFAEMNQAELELDPAVTGRVSLGVGAVSWTTVLDLVCESLGCRWTLTGPQPRTLVVRASEDGELSDPINLHLKDADPAKVLKTFGRILERETLIEGELRGGITVLFQAVTARTALTAVCESLGCLFELDDAALRIWVVPDSLAHGSEQGILDALFAPINMNLEDAPFRAVLGTFEKVVGCPVEIHPDVDGQVTIEVEMTPTETVLTQLCAQLDCHWYLSERDGGSVLVFEPGP